MGGTRARPLVPRTPVLVRVLQTLQMSILGGRSRTSPRSKDTRARARTSNTPTVHSRRQLARRPVPRTPVLVRVLQTLQMSVPGGIRARRLVPTTPVLVRVLQTIQISTEGGIRARLPVPRTPVLARVLQTFQMSILGGLRARRLVPRTPFLVCVLQRLQISILGGSPARGPVAPSSSHLESHNVTTSTRLDRRDSIDVTRSRKREDHTNATSARVLR